VKVGQHIQKLVKRLRFMEKHKRIKPMFSVSCERLFDRVSELLGDLSDTKGVIERRQETED